MVLEKHVEAFPNVEGVLEMGWVAIAVYLLLLIGIPIVSSVCFPLNGSAIGADKLMGSGLTLGSILIAVVGILLAIFDAKNLRGTNSGKPFLVLIYMLCGALVGSFGIGAGSMWFINQPSPPVLLDGLSYLLLAVIFTITAGVIGTAAYIVGWW